MKTSMLMSLHILMVLCISVAFAGQANSVPHIGKRLSLVPSFTSGFFPPSYPQFLQERVSKREDIEGSRGPPMDIANYRPSWHFGKRNGDELIKRDPLTSTWTNIFGKPDLKPTLPGKRVPWTMNWSALWPVQPTIKNDKRFDSSQRGFINRPWDSFIRSPQGFRFNDEAGDWFSRGLLVKRGRDFTSSLNSVPMMGKRDDEQIQKSDNVVDFIEDTL